MAEVPKDTAAYQKYMSLSTGNIVQAEYIWIGGSGNDIRSKTKTLTNLSAETLAILRSDDWQFPKSDDVKAGDENGKDANKIKAVVNDISFLPEWNFDGSSTEQAPGDNSEVWLIPVKMIPDPFRGKPHILVLCECLTPPSLKNKDKGNDNYKGEGLKALPTNRRRPAAEVFENKDVIAERPWFGIEQEYTLFQADGKTPLGWPRNGYPAPQGPYYCSNGAGRAFGRQIVESHYRACLYAGLSISGINGEVMAGQWEYQVGPCIGIDSGDQLWLSRYILERVSEDFGVVVSFAAKPIKGDWNGAGCHTNFSTYSMRVNPEDSKQTNAAADALKKKVFGFARVEQAILRMKRYHQEHMDVYGKGNTDRLTGSHETARFDQFSYGVANRGCSIRIPRMTDKLGYGYLEDRRPAANMDPYDVTSMIANTTILRRSEAEEKSGNRRR